MKLFFCFLFLMCSSCFGQTKTEPLHQASLLREKKQFEAALKEVNRLIDASPKVAQFYDFRADIFSSLGLLEEARADYDKAISLAPEEVVYYHHRSLFFIRMQEPGLAIEDNNRALQLEKKDTLRYVLILNRGECYRMQRDFDKAYADFLSVLQFDSTSISALNNIANVLGDLGRPEEALPYLQKLIRLYPNDVGGYVNLAFHYTEQGAYEKALELNNKVLEMDPTIPYAYNNRGFVKYKLKDLKGAMEDINHSLQMLPGNSFAFKNRALVFIELKQYHFACDDLKKAIALGYTKIYGDEVQNLLEKYCTVNN
jgi:tetratricopeptide (TPR) repeat protein